MLGPAVLIRHGFVVFLNMGSALSASLSLRTSLDLTQMPHNRLLLGMQV